MNALSAHLTPPHHADDLTLRKANRDDLDALVELISSHAIRGDMLPVSHQVIAKQIDNFLIVVNQNDLLGCGRLHPWSDGSAEVRSLAVSTYAQGRGIGRTIVQQLEKQANGNGFQRLFALTLKPAFFIKLGFQTSFIHNFPEKINHDCHQCFRRRHCAEIAVHKNLVMRSDLGDHQPYSLKRARHEETLWAV